MSWPSATAAGRQLLGLIEGPAKFPMLFARLQHYLCPDFTTSRSPVVILKAHILGFMVDVPCLESLLLRTKY